MVSADGWVQVGLTVAMLPVALWGAVKELLDHHKESTEEEEEKKKKEKEEEEKKKKKKKEEEEEEGIKVTEPLEDKASEPQTTENPMHDSAGDVEKSTEG